MQYLKLYPVLPLPGASILADVEILPHCVLIWRSFTHWIGGMGVLVFILSLLPLTGGYHMNLMKAETRDLLSASWFQKYSPLQKFCMEFILS